MSSDSNRFSLPRSRMLKKATDIRAVLKEGRRLSGKSINLFVAPDPDGFSRVAIIVPRRVGNAVQRNRMKRLVREIYRTHPDWFRGKRVVFSIKRLEEDFHRLTREIEQLVSRT